MFIRIQARRFRCLAGRPVFWKRLRRHAAIFFPLFIISCKPAVDPDAAFRELLTMRDVIEKQIQNQSRQISEQVAAFSKVIAADRDFSMKLFVENNRSAPEVTDLTLRFMEPMGFSLLEITDCRHLLLSCAQFPASVGTSIVDKAASLGEKASFTLDNVKGQKVLTIQAQVRFTILDTLFSCMGGRIVDNGFISDLSPGNGYWLVLKQGDSFIGVSRPGLISNIKDSSVVIEDRICPAVAIALPFVGQGDTPVLLLIREKSTEKNPAGR